MNPQQENLLVGTLLDDDIRVSLRELCSMCGISAELIVEMVNEGIAQPEEGADFHQWRFAGASIRRVQTTIRLQQDLRVNLAGAALALDLLEELAELRRLHARILRD
jgi:chaperone modulatory protein CbpM